MIYKKTWDLSTIPDDVFLSEAGRRNASKRQTYGGGAPVTCQCGKCRKCKMRRYRQQQRQAVKTGEGGQQ